MLYRPLRLLALALALPLLSASAEAQPDPTTTDAVFAEAMRLYSARLFEPAARAFERYRRDFPEAPRQPEALFYGAEAALASRDDARAETLFSEFRRRYPGHPLAARARLALGEFYFAAGEYELAEQALRETLAEAEAGGRAPADAARALDLLGRTALRQQRPETAIGYFQRVANEYPASPEAPRALYSIGFAEIGRGNDQTAADALRQLATRYPESVENRDAGLALAETLGRLGDFAGASAEAETRLATATGEQRARAHFIRGESLLRTGAPDRARVAFESVPPESPLGRRARFGLARIAFDQGRFVDAAEAFATVRTWRAPQPPVTTDAFAPPPPRTETTPDEDDALAHEATFYEGLALKRAGRFDEAEARLAAATARRPRGAFADAALLEHGVLRYERRLYDQAAQSFSSLLDQYPTSRYAGEAARMLGESYAAQGDFGRARDAARRAQELGSVPAELQGEVRFQDAYAFYQNNDFEQAAQRLFAVYESDPRGPRAGEALFWAGEAAFQDQRHDRAQAYMSRFLSEFPDHRQADAGRYVLGWSYFRQRNYSQAALAFERFLSAYEPRTELVPYYQDALLRLGDSYYALRRFSDAQAVYQRAAQQPQGADYALFQMAQAQRDGGNLDAALNTLDRLLQQHPNSSLAPQTRHARGAIHFQAQRYDEAIAAYEIVLQRHPGSAMAARSQYGIGDAHYNARRYAEAERAYRVVLERYPESPVVADALGGLQNALAALGRSDEAGRVADQFVERDPSSPGAEALRFRQAELAYEAGRTQEAFSGFSDFVRASRNEELLPTAYLYLGLIEAGRGNASAAEGHFRSVATRYADSDEALDARGRLGLLYLDSGRHSEAFAAFEALEAAATDEQTIAEARFGQGLALLALGRHDQAENMFRQVIQETAGTMVAVSAAVGLGRALEAQGEVEDALRVYRQAAAAGDSEPAAEATVRVARLQLTRGMAEAAVTSLTDFEERFGLYPDLVGESLLVQASALRRLGRTAEADRAIDYLLNVYDDTPAAETARRERAGR
ncbi:hypothetical protein BH23BAC4_BH23BAC4_02430 [soil metagenome]